MHVETITHASRKGFDELLNQKLDDLPPRVADKVEIQFRPVLTVANRTNDEGFAEPAADVLLYTALIVWPTRPSGLRNLPA